MKSLKESTGGSVLVVGLSASYGLPIGLLLSDSWNVVLAVCVLAVATTAVSGTSLAFWICPVVSLSAISFLASLSQLIDDDFRPSSIVFRSAFFGFWALFALRMRRYRRSIMCDGEVGTLALVSVLAGIMITYIQWDPIAGFRTISQFGEDNGAWLNNVALSLQNQATLLPDVGVSGGTLLATITTGAVSLLDSSSWEPSSFDPTAVVLVRMYGWGLLLLIIFAVAIFLRMSVSIGRGLRYPVMLVSVLLTLVFGLDFLSNGYLTALLAAVWVSASTLAAVNLGNNQEKNPILLFVMLALPVAVVGEMWFPLHYWSAVVTAGAIFGPGSQWLISRIRTRRQNKRWHPSEFRLAIVALFLLVVVAVIASSTASKYLDVFDWTKILELIHTGGRGGPSTLWVLILLAAMVTVLQADSSTRVPLIVLLVGTSVTIASVFVLALVTPPNEIAYGPRKLFQILVLSLVPLGCTLFARAVAALREVGKVSTSGLVVGALLIALIQFGMPLQNLEVMWKPRTNPYWFDAVVAARTRFPDRIPLCLDTKKGSGRSERAYECSRLVIGLVGGDRSSISEQLRTFQFGNICTVEPDEAHRLWDDEFFRSVVIVVSDRGRLSSESECQSRELTASDISPFGKESGYDVWPTGWLSSIRWNLVKVIDVEGNDVEPSFRYLVDDPLDAPRIEDLELLSRYQST